MLNRLLDQALAACPNLTDLLLVPGNPPQVDVKGRLGDLVLAPPIPILSPFQTARLAWELLNSKTHLLQELIQRGACDLSVEHYSGTRFRTNIFLQKGSIAIVFRSLPQATPTIEGLALPSIFEDITRFQSGLVLVTGPTGCGKSTSLAAVLNKVNRTLPVHVITLEDPVEFVHTPGKALVTQRELGGDFNSFPSGLTAALRQAPKIIMVGEIRDRETLRIALQAGETGHLVLSSMHTTDVSQTVNRIIGLFSAQEEQLIRQRLAQSLKVVVGQRLLPSADGTRRLAAFEIMRSTLRTREIILLGESNERRFRDALKDGWAYGMLGFDDDISRLYQENLVTEEVARLYASDAADMARNIDRINTERGVSSQTSQVLLLQREKRKEDDSRFL